MSASQPKPPSPKDVVQAIMSFVGRGKRRVFDTAIGRTVAKEYVSYRCPKPGCSVAVVSFLDKTGFKNPYCHLKRCYAKGLDSFKQEAELYRLYNDARAEAEKNGGTIRSHFDIQSLSEYEKGIYQYLRLIVTKNIPVSYVEDAEVRKSFRYNMKVSVETITRVMVCLVEHVENRIAAELENTQGALRFDGWPCNDTHYVAAIASYCTKVSERSYSVDEMRNIPQLTLLSISPMSQLPPQDTADTLLDGETTTFNAEAHLQLFREFFPYFGQEFEKWCLCLLGDNTSTNKKVARLCGKPFVGCNSHKRNLEVNSMVNAHADLSRVLDSVHETMREAKQLKNAAILRNLTDLKPVMHNKTRWSGKLEMLRRFEQVRVDLIEVTQSRDVAVSIDSSVRFDSKARKYRAMLTEIDVVTKSLQTRGHSLAACRDDLDCLINTVSEEKENPMAALYQCRLGTKYISPSARIVGNPSFEAVVVKLQKGTYDELSDAEKTAVNCLRKPGSSNESIELDSPGHYSRMTMGESLAKHRKKDKKNIEYISCDFILGSVSEIERLFSVAKNVLTPNRRSMTPHLFESLVFLKLNERFWDPLLVSQAINGVRSERAEARIRAHNIHLEQFLDETI